MVTANKPTRNSVFRRFQIASILDEQLIWNLESLKDSTKYPETSSVTENCDNSFTIEA